MTRKDIPRPVSGGYKLHIQPRAISRRKDPLVPEFEPNWIARIRLPGRDVRPESTKILVCEDCMADKVRGKTPRESCPCKADADLWAYARLSSLSRLHADQRLQEELDRTKPKAKLRVRMDRVLAIYDASCDLRDKAKTLSGVRRLCSQWFGRSAAEVWADEWEEEGMRRWVRMSQEVGRRWLRDNARAPEEAWPTVRALSSLPPIDERRPESWNRTIKSGLAQLSQVLGEDGRKRYLRELAAELPPLMPWLIKHGLQLPTRDNRVDFTSEQIDALERELPQLRTENIHAWLMVQLAFLSGWRSGAEIKAVQRHWFMRYPDGSLRLERRQRPEDGYELKTSSETVTHVPVPAEVADYITALAPDAPLFGNADATYRRCNDWLVEKGVVPAEWEHRLYALRKLNATARARISGTAAAGAALGHDVNSPVTAQSYIAPGIVQVPALTMEMARAGVQERNYEPLRK